MRLLDISQLSVMLNVKTRTIYDLVRKRQIPYIKIGRLLRFDPNKIDKWREENSYDVEN